MICPDRYYGLQDCPLIAKVVFKIIHIYFAQYLVSQWIIHLVGLMNLNLVLITGIYLIFCPHSLAILDQLLNDSS